MMSLTGAQARALFDLVDGAARLTLRAGGTRAPYPVVVEARADNGRLITATTIDLNGAPLVEVRPA